VFVPCTGGRPYEPGSTKNAGDAILVCQKRSVAHVDDEVWNCRL
jgi:hypothetical protein